MANTKTTIELNGTLYDAVSGKAVNSQAPQTIAPTPATPQAAPGSITPPPTSPRNVDGFFKPASKAVVAPAKPVAPTPVQATATPAKEKPAPAREAVTAPNHAQAHQPERAKTLMRHAIDKPKVSAPIDENTTPALPTPNDSFREREARASRVSKSPSISRFGGRLPTAIDKKHVDHVPVIEPPHDAPAAEKHLNSFAKTRTSPKLRAEEPQAKAQAEAVPAISFASAIANATSHEEETPAKPKLHQRTAKKLGTTTKMLGAGGATLAVLLIAGFIAFKSVPTVQMQLAATRAGFSASLPGYTPAGFSMKGGIDADQGAVTVNYKSNSDDRNFQVSQKPSNWTSESLLTNYVSSDKKAYQTYEERGKTIYIYEGSNATWVNGGVWYEIKGDSSLSSDQLLHIANSF